MTAFEVEAFIFAVENELLCKYEEKGIDYILEKSSLYRLITSYNTIKTLKKSSFDFKEYINIISAYSENIDVTFSSNAHRMICEIILDSIIFIQSPYQQNNKFQLIHNDGYVFPDDFKACKELNNFFNLKEDIKFYKNAVVMGCPFKGRGFNFKEKTKPNADNTRYGQQGALQYVPVNPLNCLKKNWRFKNNYSSWCKFNYKSNLKYFGQLNYFFNLKIDGEKLLNSVGFASVTTRKYTTDRFGVQKIECDDKVSFNHEICFIPIRIIVPTSILVAGFDEEKKPYKKIGNIHHEANLLPYFSEQSTDKIKHLILIDLDPAQNLIQY
jgi:hypothetical protein